MTGSVQHCPVCGTEIDDEQWCGGCDRHVSDEEITEHERMWGELWLRGA